MHPGGERDGQPFPPSHDFGFFNKYTASFVELMPKEDGCRWGNLVLGVTGRNIEQQKRENLGVSNVG